MTALDKPPSCVPQGRSLRKRAAWRQGEVFGPAFCKKVAVGKAEPYGLHCASQRRRGEKASGGRLFVGVSASAPVGPACHRHPGPHVRGAWRPGGTRQRRPRRQPRFLDWAVRSSVVTAAFPCPTTPSARRPLAEATAGFQPLGASVPKSRHKYAKS